MKPVTLPTVPGASSILSALLPLIASELTSKPVTPDPALIVKVFAPPVLKVGDTLLATCNSAMVSFTPATAPATLVTIGEGVPAPKIRMSVAAGSTRGDGPQFKGLVQSVLTDPFQV